MYYILAILAAFALSAFQYLYKRKALWLFILRFFSWLVLFVLLINPKIDKKTQIITKPDLYILADNSLSISKQKAKKTEKTIIRQLKNAGFDDKFQIHFFKFGKNLSLLDSLTFTANQTNIASALSEVSDIHQKEQTAPIVLITDGQSNLGQDYVLQANQFKKFEIYPVAIGDTVSHQDIRIDLVNTNPYAYKDNYFPVEIFVSGKIAQKTPVSVNIYEKKQLLFHKNIQLSPGKQSARLLTKLQAKKIGVHHYVVVISGLKNELNKLNNRAYFSVEVLKNAKKILLVSNIIHPDLGALKRSLSLHKNIKVELVHPGKFHGNLNDYQTVILYQPTSAFKTIFEQIKKQKKSWWVITGTHTNWSFINSQNLFFKRQAPTSTENYFAVPNQAFSLFKLPELKTKNLPPLRDSYGHIHLSATAQTAYYSKINGLLTKEPLLVLNSQDKQAALLGENLWQWMMQAGVQQQKNELDRLIYQVVQYLSMQTDLDRLQLDFKRQYYQSEPISIRAHFLDKNLAPDSKVEAVLTLKSSNGVQSLPMTFEGDYYQVNLENLKPGNYNFTVQNKDKSLKKSGHFMILPFSLEVQNTGANTSKLNALAKQSGTEFFTADNVNSLIKLLKNTDKYKAHISYKTKNLPLIDYKLLLFLLVLLLGTEWLIKKLRGEL